MSSLPDPDLGQDESDSQAILPGLADVSRLAGIIDQMEASVKERDDLISVAAHELRAPVTSIRGFTQMLLRQYQRTGGLDPARIAESLEVIDQQSRRLSGLIEQMLDLARFFSGKLLLDREEVDLSALVEGVILSVRCSYQDREVSLRCAGATPVCVDRLRVEQVVINLIDNAVKFSPEGAPVEVEVGKDATGWVRIGVRDHGIGIPAEKRGLVFDRYYQASRGKRNEGMGIGLFVSRQIVEMHEGFITVDQPKEGGSLFVVMLPPVALLEDVRPG